MSLPAVRIDVVWDVSMITRRVRVSAIVLLSKGSVGIVALSARLAPLRVYAIESLQATIPGP